MIDFYQEQCSEYTNEPKFGLCDDQNGQKAYIDIDQIDTWVASISNPQNQQVRFIAVDACVFTKEEIKRCDGILISDSQIVFIELKDKEGKAFKTGVKQIGVTIQKYKEAVGEDCFENKNVSAYVCNKKKSLLKVPNNSTQVKFYEEFGFRVFYQNNIALN